MEGYGGGTSKKGKNMILKIQIATVVVMGLVALGLAALTIWICL